MRSHQYLLCRAQIPETFIDFIMDYYLVVSDASRWPIRTYNANKISNLDLLTIRPFSSPWLKTTLVNCSTFAFLLNFTSRRTTFQGPWHHYGYFFVFCCISKFSGSLRSQLRYATYTIAISNRMVDHRGEQYRISKNWNLYIFLQRNAPIDIKISIIDICFTNMVPISKTLMFYLLHEWKIQ